ncbi:DUF4983 domain-containing protein [Chitinophagaceae bacterium 26-R-25]|nr:DUF4983 domain-containing protein [Chitinophagaceae bacterium 26-R-25]
MHKIIVFSVAMFITAAGILQSCKKFTNLPPYEETYSPDTLANGKRKMLIIAIDGIRGQEFQKDSGKVMSTVWSLLPHSKYSFSGIADDAANNAASIAALLNGVSSNVSGISDSTLQIQSNPNDPEASNQLTLNVFARLTDANPFINIAAITPWRQFSKRFLSYATMNYVTTGDAESKDSAVSVLTKSNADIVFVHLNGPEISGEANDFVFSDPNYKQAVSNTDNYIKSIMQALQARTHYSDGKENWMVMITSNSGGNKGTIAQQKNIFSLYYNKGFNSKLFNPIACTALRVYGDTAAGTTFPGIVLLSGKTANPNFNIPKNQGLTAEFRIKYIPDASGNYSYANPFIFGTEQDRYYPPGWSFWMGGSNMAFCLKPGTAGGNGKPETTAGAFNDGKWHTVAGTITNTGTSSTVTIFKDGLKQGTSTVAMPAGLDSIHSTFPLALGNRVGAAKDPFGQKVDPNFYINDIRIWKTVLPDSILFNYVSLKDATQHPYYSSMVGYWPCDEGGGDTLKSKLATAANFVASKAPGVVAKWYLLNDAPQTFGTPTGDPLTRNTSLFPNVLYWFNVPVSAGWKPALDYGAWLDQYLVEFSR